VWSISDALDRFSLCSGIFNSPLQEQEPYAEERTGVYSFSGFLHGDCLYNPHGPQLMGVPLIPTDFASQYINELKPLSLNDLLTFQIPKVFSPSNTTFNILFVLACISAAKCILQARIA